MPADKILELKKVDNKTRAGYEGRMIICPQCKKGFTVYHFSWNACICDTCRKMIDKKDWYTIK